MCWGGPVLVIWFAGQDPTFTGEAPLDLLRDAGLMRQDGTAKPAWTIRYAADGGRRVAYG